MVEMRESKGEEGHWKVRRRKRLSSQILGGQSSQGPKPLLSRKGPELFASTKFAHVYPEMLLRIYTCAGISLSTMAFEQHGPWPRPGAILAHITNVTYVRSTARCRARRLTPPPPRARAVVTACSPSKPLVPKPRGRPSGGKAGASSAGYIPRRLSWSKYTHV